MLLCPNLGDGSVFSISMPTDKPMEGTDKPMEGTDVLKVNIIVTFSTSVSYSDL